LNQEAFMQAVEGLKKLQIADTERLIQDVCKKGGDVLAEGAQGTLLDVEFGSYPFVTSSHTTAAGACIGLGVPPRAISKVFGVFKAYCTRVGNGPFPTELQGDIAELIRKTGQEFGATTGRPRRCGWLDLPALKYAMDLNGVTDLIITKADILSQIPEIQVCTHYQIIDRSVVYINKVIPEYQRFPVWKTQLPNEPFQPELEKYLQFIEKQVETKIKYVSVGTARDEMIGR